ncbi:MAG: glycerol-3-phosphate 1-O-acyltransferase PlsB [Gammaproteobacteria bacterium]|nr:glycerol-3-phosphate 1-O-acyltransferase PlsB [Gammaproteobacteria bacterium]
MRWFNWIADLGLATIRGLVNLWVRFDVAPGDLKRLHIPESGVCYVLENDLVLDALVLDAACRRHELPRLTGSSLVGRRAVFGVRRFRGVFIRRPDPSPSRRLQRLVETALADPGIEITLVPVAVFWGRAPAREHSWLKLLFAEQWALAGRTRGALAALLHGRNVLVQFGEPVALRTLMDIQTRQELAVRRASRLLRRHFRGARAAVIGPDLSHRRSLIAQLLTTAPVRQAIADEAAATGQSPGRVREQARRYGMEIAADYSYPAILMFEKLMTWMWTRLYDGIALHQIEQLGELAREHELVYVPCHRSHIDYMILSYVVYKQGLAIPYIAAGINLNLPLLGPLLRRGGAFFIRRSFSGNALYTAVFRGYLAAMLSRGHPIEYFIEGTRSRTGRLLPHRTGMLSMTVHSYLCQPVRPLAFVPVYFGYEKLVEGQTYIGELSGQGKKKESIGGLLRSVRTLREHFGHVQVSIGEPLHLSPVLDAHRPDWRGEEHQLDTRPAWLGEVVDELGREILVRINSAAVVNPVNLVALVLLAMPKQAMVERDLAAQISMYLQLLKRKPWAMESRLPDMDARQVIHTAETLKVVQRHKHDLGDVIYMDERRALLATYFRNNVQHLLALHGMVACCYMNHRSLGLRRIRRLIALTYPYVSRELRLPWSRRELRQALNDTLAAMASAGLLRPGRGKRIWSRARAGSNSTAQLMVLGQSMMPTLQRYYLVVALLLQGGSGKLRRSELLDLSQQVAERLSLVFELHSPDFFDRAVFSAFIDGMRREGVLSIDGEQRLHFDDRLREVDEDARQVLGAQIRQSLQQVLSLVPEQVSPHPSDDRADA